MTHDWETQKVDQCNCFHCRHTRMMVAEKAKAEDMAARLEPVDPLAQAYMDRDGMNETEAADVAAAVRDILAG